MALKCIPNKELRGVFSSIQNGLLAAQLDYSNKLFKSMTKEEIDIAKKWDITLTAINSALDKLEKLERKLY